MAQRHASLRARLLCGFVLAVAVVVVVTAAYQMPYRYTLDLGSTTDRLEPTYLSRFNAADRTPQRDFRWSQADSYIRILPIANRMQATLTYLDVSPDAPRTATFTADDGESGGTKREIGNTAQPRIVTLPVNAADTPYILRNSAGNIYEIWFGGIVHIEVPPASVKGDARPLGLAIDRMEVESRTDGLLPPLAVLLMFVFVVLMPYVLLITLRLRTWWVLAAGLLVASGVGAGLLVARRSLLDLSSHILIVAVIGYYGALFLGTRKFFQQRAASLSRDKEAQRHREEEITNEGTRARRLERDREDISVGEGNFGRREVGEGFAPHLDPMVLLLWVMRVVVLAATLIVEVAPLLPQGEALPTRKGVLPMYVPWWQFYRDLPLWFTLVGTVVVLAGVAASFQNVTPRSSPSHAPFPTKEEDGKRQIGIAGVKFYKVIVALLSLPLFWLLRVRASVGDTVNVVGALVRHTFFENEFFDFCLHSYIYRTLEGIVKPANLREANNLAQTAYQIPSVLMGGVFVYVTLLLAERLVSGRLARAIVAIFVLSSGTMLLYFGYVESYPTPYLVALIFAYTAIGALRDPDASIRWPALWLALGIVLHQQMIFLGPAFVFVLWWRATLRQAQDGRGGQVVWARLWREIAAAVVVGLAPLLLLWAMATNLEYTLARWYAFAKVFGGGSDGGYFKPLLRATTPEEQYGVLSGEYLMHIANLQCLLAPLGLVIIVSVMAQRWLPAMLRERANRAIVALVVVGVALFWLSLILDGKRPVVLLTLPALAMFAAALWLGRARLHRLADPTLALLAILALFTFIFGCVWNPDMGWDDWNLLSANGIFINLLAGYCLVKYGSRGGWLRRAAMITLPFVCVHVAGWVAANAFGLAHF